MWNGEVPPPFSFSDVSLHVTIRGDDHHHRHHHHLQAFAAAVAIFIIAAAAAAATVVAATSTANTYRERVTHCAKSGTVSSSLSVVAGGGGKE